MPNIYKIEAIFIPRNKVIMDLLPMPFGIICGFEDN